MSERYKIGESVLQEMRQFLRNEKLVGQSAHPPDMDFLNDGTWLKDAAVIDVISNREGAWDIYMIFAHYKNPLKLIVRNITRCFTKQKATAAAFYIRKEAAKDRRGTLTLSIVDLGLCSN